MKYVIRKTERLLKIALLAVLSFCTFCASATENVTATINTDSEFANIADNIWAEYLSSSPISATYSGLKENADKLPDLSPNGFKVREAKLSRWIALLQETELNKTKGAGLSEQAVINRTILLHRLQNELDQIKYKAHYMPLTAEGGFHTSMAFLPSVTQLESVKDIEDYLARLANFEEYFEQNIYWMKKGLKTRFTQPKVVLKGYEQTITGLISDNPADSVFYKPFLQSMSFLTANQIAKVQARAKSVIETSVNQAYKNFETFMTTEYIPNARKTIGISETPNGNEYYQNRSMHYTTTDLSADKIHQIGLQEVARIRSEMAEIIKAVKFEGEFSEFLDFLRSDPQFYATSAKQLLMEASFIAKKMDAQLPKLFKNLPRTPYGVAPVPAHIAPKYTTGRYISASKDTDAGYYWVNTYALDRRPLYELEALTLHEAVPGHHLQISLTKELENTPEYRSSYYISAFGEGWGLYAEWLGLEVGFYQDPYSNFGRLTYEMWRALRLVVDTGMHIKGWTRQQAIDYMTENSALSAHNIQTEVDRYISWPGQALSYKIGELMIKKLRKEAEQTLGDKFNVREFHYHVLKNGSVPLSQLETQIQQYISANK